jgi:hypothetical protein
MYCCHRVLTECVMYVCHRVSTECVMYCCHRVSTECVMYCCHRVSTQLRLNIYISYIISIQTLSIQTPHLGRVTWEACSVNLETWEPSQHLLLELVCPLTINFIGSFTLVFVNRTALLLLGFVFISFSTAHAPSLSTFFCNISLSSSFEIFL